MSYGTARVAPEKAVFRPALPMSFLPGISEIQMATKRKAISKKTRFEVFKRDGFVCQYCGAHPPSVILHVDHIQAVANGGLNEMDNYITACESCNLGKSARALSEIPQSLKDKAGLIAEREEQILGYQRVMNSKRLRLDDEGTEVREVYEKFNPGFTLSDSAMVSVKTFIDRIGMHKVINAMERAWTNPSIRRNGEFKYFCGICWGIIKETKNGPL